MDFRHKIGIMKNILNNFQIHILATGGSLGSFPGVIFAQNRKILKFTSSNFKLSSPKIAWNGSKHPKFLRIFALFSNSLVCFGQSSTTF